LHRELPRKSLGTRGEKKKKKGRRSFPETAPQDIGDSGKNRLDFAIFS
jgi:hypothetical protein